jgi:ATP-binding cassette, subfamily B, bacterial
MSAAPSTLRRVGTSFWPYRRRLALLAAVTVIIAELNVARLLLIKPIFDRALFCGVGCPNLALLGWLVATMLTVAAMAALLGYWQPYLATALGQRVMRDLRDALYAHLQRMSVRFFTETKNGEIQSRFANDVGGVQRVVTEFTSLMLMYAVTFLSTVVAMAMLFWQLTALSVTCAPLFVWLTRRTGDARRTVALFERIFEYLDLRPDIVDAPDALELPAEHTRAAISLRAVTLNYSTATATTPGFITNNSPTTQ